MEWNVIGIKQNSPHVVIDNFFKEDVAQSVYDNFPSTDDNIWFYYNNPLEQFKKFKIPKYINLILIIVVKYRHFKIKERKITTKRRK